jgi:hypothetical protein
MRSILVNNVVILQRLKIRFVSRFREYYKLLLYYRHQYKTGIKEKSSLSCIYMYKKSGQTKRLWSLGTKSFCIFRLIASWIIVSSSHITKRNSFGSGSNSVKVERMKITRQFQPGAAIIWHLISKGNHIKKWDTINSLSSDYLNNGLQQVCCYYEINSKTFYLLQMEIKTKACRKEDCISFVQGKYVNEQTCRMCFNNQIVKTQRR